MIIIFLFYGPHVCLAIIGYPEEYVNLEWYPVNPIRKISAEFWVKY